MYFAALFRYALGAIVISRSLPFTLLQLWSCVVYHVDFLFEIQIAIAFKDICYVVVRKRCLCRYHHNWSAILSPLAVTNSRKEGNVTTNHELSLPCSPIPVFMFRSHARSYQFLILLFWCRW